MALLLDTPSRAESKKHFKLAITLLTITATVVRLELALFVVPLALNLVIREKLSFEEGFVAGAIGGFSGLGTSRVWSWTDAKAASVSIDSYLWSKLTWPEAAGVHFNIYEGKASAWGVSPSHHYITGLPRMLLFSTPLLLLGLAIPSVRRSGLLGLLLPSIAGLVGGMSCVGHKVSTFAGISHRLLNDRNGASLLMSCPASMSSRLSLPRTCRSRTKTLLSLQLEHENFQDHSKPLSPCTHRWAGLQHGRF